MLIPSVSAGTTGSSVTTLTTLSPDSHLELFDLYVTANSVDLHTSAVFVQHLKQEAASETR